MNVILAAKRPEARDVTSFMFRSASPMKWQAGQFLQYSLPDTQGADERGMTRYFTIASAPFEGQIMLTTRFASERSSTFKRALQHLPVGAAVVVGEPDGDFVVADPANKHVFIAGGIGITPFRAILRDLDHRGLPINATLLYANGTPEFVYKAEIDRLAGQHRRLVVHYLVSPQRLTAASIRAAVADLAQHRFYVSGPESFVESMASLLSGLGLPDAQVQRDYFPGYDRPSIEQKETA
jgi:glycine betaine catabolism B